MYTETYTKLPLSSLILLRSAVLRLELTKVTRPYDSLSHINETGYWQRASGPRDTDPLVPLTDWLVGKH